MPRIDPLQLLTCLNSLLAPNGGIKGPQDVQRLANLMEKFSKKLVSKCIYIQILKCTETELLEQFMGVGGWMLTYNWLQDGITTGNWPLIQELLEMLLLCPVDLNRLKSNVAPKLVKSLSVNCVHNGVRLLASKLVEQWLKIAHMENHKSNIQSNNINENNKNGFVQSVIADGVNNNLQNHVIFDDEEPLPEKLKNDINTSNGIETISNNVEENVAPKLDGQTKDTVESKIVTEPPQNVKYKISSKEGGGLLLQIKRSTSPMNETDEPDKKIAKSSESKEKSSSNSNGKSSSDKNKKSSTSSSRKSNSSSSSKSTNRDKDRDKSSSHKSSGRISSGSDRSSKDRDRSKSSKHSDRPSSSSSSRSRHHSSTNQRDKEKERDKRQKQKDAEKLAAQVEKDHESLNLFAPLPPSAKLAKIPKKTLENGETKKIPVDGPLPKKPSISIEVRKGDKPKTVKTFNSQFRSHGLEEAPPPPTRKGLIKKSGPSLPSPSAFPSAAVQSSSPTSLTNGATSIARVVSPPPVKKAHLDKTLEGEIMNDRVGGVKLIKPKPMLIESVSFMDALSASALPTKKESKKRKRVPSISKKDEPESPKIVTAPLKFYKDTMEDNTEEEVKDLKTKEIDSNIVKTENGENEMAETEEEKSSEAIEEENKETVPVEEAEKEKEEVEDEKRPPGPGCGPDGPPGVLIDIVHRRKRTKKSLKWRPQEELEEVRYFELDKTERVNVTKTFMEQEQMERCDESRAFALGRKLQSYDTMLEIVPWQPLIPVDDVPEYPYGSKSREMKIQAEREKTVLQDLYLDRHLLIDSPHEPDAEHYDHVDPIIIPLEDLTGNPDAVNNYTDIPWPEAKGNEPLMNNGLGRNFISNNDPFSSMFPNMQKPPFMAVTPFFMPDQTHNNQTYNPMTVPNPLDFQLNNMLGSATNAANAQTSPMFMNKLLIPPSAQSVPFIHPPPLTANTFNMNQQRNLGMGIGNNNINNISSNTFRSRGNIANNGNQNWNRSNAGNNGRNWVQGNRGICKQFAQKGFCRNGDSCIYSHKR